MENRVGYNCTIVSNHYADEWNNLMVRVAVVQNTPTKNADGRNTYESDIFPVIIASQHHRYFLDNYFKGQKCILEGNTKPYNGLSISVINQIMLIERKNGYTRTSK